MNLGMLRRGNRKDAVSADVATYANARLRLELNEQARRAAGGFGPWLKEVTPEWQWDPIHFRYARWYLNKVTHGDIQKLMIFMPPRHGKTEQNTIRYAAYRIELDPSIKVMVVSYNKELASDFSRKIKAIVEQRVELSNVKRAAHKWETKAGGGLNAFGVRGVGGGRGYDLIILDDVIKNADEANSPTYRERMWQSWLNDISKRVNPNCKIIITFTRWHRDDLAGRILASEDGPNWTVVKLPALAEANDPMGRPEGMALWPDRWSEEWLRGEQRIDIYAFESLFQQNPTSAGGKMFTGDWTSDCYVDALPGGCRFVRYWDKAGTKGGSGAATAGVLMAKTPKGTYVVCDVERGRWGSVEREERIKTVAQRDSTLTEIRIEQEPGSSGKESAEGTIRNLEGYAVTVDRVTGDKAVRAQPLASRCKVGDVKLLKDTPYKRWNGTFLAELEVFPQGMLKDQVDAAAGAYNYLALGDSPGSPVVGGHSVISRVDPGELWLPDQSLWSPGL
jgi:predicted phage terminase large subunit-like protein